MARKKRKSLREMQREKLKRQRSITKTKSNNLASQRVEKVKVKVEPQKQLRGSGAKNSLPSGSKGGDIQKTRVRRSNINKSPVNKTQMGTKGGGVKPPLRLPPAGKTAANLLKNNAVTRSAGSKLGSIGLALGGIATAQDLAASLKRGEGYASLPGHISRALKGNNNNKTTSKQTTNKRGRRITSSSSKPSSSKPTKSGSSESAASLARKQGLANNQRAAGMSADLRGSVSKKATAKPTTKPSGGSTTKPKPKTRANDPRNASYISSAKKLNSSKTTTKKDRDALRDKGLSTWAKANPKLAKALEKKKAKKAARRAGGTLYSGTTGMSSIG